MLWLLLQLVSLFFFFYIFPSLFRKPMTSKLQKYFMSSLAQNIPHYPQLLMSLHNCLGFTMSHQSHFTCSSHKDRHRHHHKQEQQKQKKKKQKPKLVIIAKADSRKIYSNNSISGFGWVQKQATQNNLTNTERITRKKIRR